MVYFTFFTSGVTGKFFWGAKLLFPIFSWRDFSPFSPGENFCFGGPRRSFTAFLKVKKGPQLFSIIFPLHFSFSSFLKFFLIFILLFSIFSHFPQNFPFFLLASFSRLVAKTFPVENLWGSTLSPPPFLLHHWWEWIMYWFWVID